MKNLLLIALAALALTSCGTLGSFSRAVQESNQLQTRSDELEEKMDLLDETIAAYGPIAESFGPEVQDAYAKLVEKTSEVRGYVEQGEELLSEATALHKQSLMKATDPDTGETDWVQYSMLMLLGGGGLVNERRKTGQEKKKTDARIDDRKKHIYDVEKKLMDLEHLVALQEAKRGAAA